MTLVLAADVVVKGFVQEDGTAAALRLVDHAPELLAPDLSRLVPLADQVATARAIMLDRDHPIYDGLDLAPAEAVDAELVTDDRRLDMRTAGPRFDARVQRLER